MSLVGLPSAMPIGISPDARDSGVGILAGGDGIRPRLGPWCATPVTRTGCGGRSLVRRPLPNIRAKSSLECRLSKLGLVPADLLEPGPEDVRGLAGMVDGIVLEIVAVDTAFDDGAGRGRGRSR